MGILTIVVAASTSQLAEWQPTRVPVSDLESLRSRPMRKKGGMRNHRQVTLMHMVHEALPGHREASQAEILGCRDLEATLCFQSAFQKSHDVVVWERHRKQQVGTRLKAFKSQAK